MTWVPTLDVRALPRVNPDHKAPLWWGILGLILIELTVVSGFAVSYLYLLTLASNWPAVVHEPPPHLLESINVALLAASAVAMWWAGRGMKRGNRRVLIIGLVLALGLDALVLVLRWLQFERFDFRWYTDAHGSAVWTLTGFHFVHVVSAIIGTVVVLLLAVKGFWTSERQLAVVVDTMYWYFVSFAWVPLYVVIYWSPVLVAS